MATYSFNDMGGIEIDFAGVKPSAEVRAKLKSVKYRWNPNKMIWWAYKTDETVGMAKEICGDDAETVEEAVSAPVITNKTEPIMNGRCCYSNTVESFLKETKDNWLRIMKSAFSDEYVLSLGKPQINAWEDCFVALQEQLQDFEEEAPGFSIIFEYALPYESGRRPDVILVSEEFVLILEFKMKNEILEADLDQTRAYGRDIREYHYESRNRDVRTFLVLTRAENIRTDLSHAYGSVVVCSKDWLAVVLGDAICGNDVGSYHEQLVTACDAEKWMDSKYEPLPTIVDAAKMFMNHETLPNIRRVNSTGIPDAIKFLTELTEEAKKNKKHVLALVTGVPGAGKTFLGLKYVYDICESNENANSVYLSGNGPLIKVLTDALQSNVFVKSIHTVVNEHIAGKSKGFNKNILVFDEGQRAWDKQQMSSKRRTDKSEPDVLVELADEELDWAVLLILVGEGQEINTGENSGLMQWNTALNKSRIDWEVVCPDKLSTIFERDHVVVKDNNLNLNTTLRSYLASDVSKFVNILIEGDIKAANGLSDSILEAGFNMYVTRDLNTAKDYCISRYAGNENKRYGLMASSKAYNLSSYRMKPQFQPDVAAWFNKAPSEAGSCCQLEVTVSEFDCQGLEVDMPIVGWGTDMLWTGTGWSKFKNKEDADSEANTYRINSYRVLLTRGRDGFIIFIPNEEKFNSTYDALIAAGVRNL